MENLDASTLAVVVARLDDMKKAQESYETRMMNEIQGLREELKSNAQDKVSRGEWTQRNAHVDSKFDKQGAEVHRVREDLAADISELKQENAAKKSPLTAWLALAISGMMALWAIFGSISTGDNGAESDNPVQEQSL